MKKVTKSTIWKHLKVSLWFLLSIIFIISLLLASSFLSRVLTICIFFTIFVGMKYLFMKLPEQNADILIANLKRNWFFPISAMAFFGMNVTSIDYILGMGITYILFVIATSQIKSLRTYSQQSNQRLCILSLLSATGISWGVQSAYVVHWNDAQMANEFTPMLPFQINISLLTIPFAILSIYFVYFCVLFFWNELSRIATENEFFQGITWMEAIVYSLSFLVSVFFVIVIFMQTNAFYGTESSFDIIYTSDSSLLVKGNVYLALTHPENDLRQPLFAVFAAPFIGIPCLIGKLFSVSASVQAMLTNIVQIAMMYSANFILAKMVTSNPLKRICFMVLMSCTYMQLLFIFMMEQYIVAYFWLILCMYSIIQKNQPNRIVLWGAGGTLLTSMILLPSMSEKSPMKDFKAWFFDMVKYGLEFVGLILLFCRFDVSCNLYSKADQLISFTGKSITMADKFFQYTTFIANCFFAPNAGLDINAYDYVSWQLDAATAVNIAGIVIFLLAVLSVFLNRTKKSSLLAIGWAAFSTVMLFGLGWGTQENGLVLYALYFGWAFLVLLFQLAEWAGEKLHSKTLVPVISVGSAIAFAIINIPAIAEMISFAITYYPA